MIARRRRDHLGNLESVGSSSSAMSRPSVPRPSRSACRASSGVPRGTAASRPALVPRRQNSRRQRLPARVSHRPEAAGLRLLRLQPARLANVARPQLSARGAGENLVRAGIVDLDRFLVRGRSALEITTRHGVAGHSIEAEKASPGGWSNPCSSLLICARTSPTSSPRLAWISTQLLSITLRDLSEGSSANPASSSAMASSQAPRRKPGVAEARNRVVELRSTACSASDGHDIAVGVQGRLQVELAQHVRASIHDPQQRVRHALLFGHSLGGVDESNCFAPTVHEPERIGLDPERFGDDLRIVVPLRDLQYLLGHRVRSWHISNCPQDPRKRHPNECLGLLAR